MANDDKPNFLRAAFANVYNLSLLTGALTASFATGEYMLGAAALGLEAIWLLLGPELRPFQRSVKEAARKEQEQKDRARVDKLIGTLPERDWQRAKALDELRREIERDMQHNPSFQAILLQTELDKLSQLHASFVTLASACVRAESYLSATDVRELKRQLEVQKTLEEKMADPTVRDIARKNHQVIEKRLVTIAEIEKFLARARGQMNLIENSVRLLRDQVLTMASPDQLGDQLSDLLTGVDAIQQTARDNEVLLTQLEPIAPIKGPGSQEQQGTGPTRLRS
jgi:hypothetical protein